MMTVITNEAIKAILTSLRYTGELTEDLSTSIANLLTEFAAKDERHSQMVSVSCKYFTGKPIHSFCSSQRFVYQSAEVIKHHVAKHILYLEKGTYFSEIENISIDVLQLSPRVRNALLRGDLKTIGDIVALIRFRGIGNWGVGYRNCGPVTMREVERRIAEVFPEVILPVDRSRLKAYEMIEAIEYKVDETSDLGELHEVLTDLISTSIGLTSFKDNVDIERTAIRSILDYYRDALRNATTKESDDLAQVFKDI